MDDSLWQVFTVIVCLALIWRSLKLHRSERRFDVIILLIPLVAGLTILFYAVVLLTDLNELNHELFTRMSSILRLAEYSMLLFGVEAMLKHEGRRG